MKKLFPILLAGAICAPPCAKSACVTQSSGLGLGIPALSDSGSVWAPCYNNDMILLNGTLNGYQFPYINVSTISAISSSGVYFSSAVTMNAPLVANSSVTASEFFGPLSGSASLNVLKAGDTMTGDLTLTSSTGAYMSGATFVNAVMTADTAIPVNTVATILAFNSARSDVLSEFNTTTHSFVPQTSGYYDITASCYIYSGAEAVVVNSQYDIIFYENGSPANGNYDHIAYGAGTTTGTNIGLHDILFLNAGTVFAVYATNNNGTSAVACYAPISYLTIRKLP